MIINYKKDWLNPVEDGHFGFSDKLKKQLDNIKKLINTKDRDFVLIADGAEGSGKSTLVSQVCKIIDPSFSQDRMCLRPDEFVEKVTKAKKGQAVVFDEAYTGLASRSSFSDVNKLLVEMMMEMRKKNLFIVLCIPSVFYLEKYVALHRARGLMHCYFRKSARGRFLLYNDKKLKQLYIYGKKNMTYSVPKVNFKSKFVSTAPIDWESYEKRKIEALHFKKRGSLTQKQMDQRDVVISILLKHPKLNMSGRNLSENLTLLGVPIGRTTINKSFDNIKDKLKCDINELWGDVP